MTILDKFSEFGIPKDFFVENLKENRPRSIKLAFVRETINPIIIRSIDPDSTITLRLSNKRELVEIPPRKIKSREKLLGLMICREFGMVDKSVRYNSIMNKQFLNNPNSVLFGDSVTQSKNQAALPSRAIYDWAYSLRDAKEITERLQHNALSEDGTILKDFDSNQNQKNGAKVASQALHQTEYVQPNTYFPHFITVDNITPELFFHLLSCVLNQHRYGAQTTTNANNMSNHLVAIGLAHFEKPINSYTISKEWYERQQQGKGKDTQQEAIKAALTLETVKTLLEEQMDLHYGKGCLKGDRIAKLTGWLNSLWKEYGEINLEIDESKKKEARQADTLFQIYAAATSSVTQYLTEVRMISSDEKATEVADAIQALKAEIGKNPDEASVLAKLKENARGKLKGGDKAYIKLIKEQLAEMDEEDENNPDQA